MWISFVFRKCNFWLKNYIFSTLSDFFSFLQPSLLVNMSWQSYVDDQLLATGVSNTIRGLKYFCHTNILLQQVADAIIMGHDGNAWATSAGANAKPEQLKAIVTNFGDIPTLAQNGITIGDTKYMFLSASDKVIRGKRNQK